MNQYGWPVTLSARVAKRDQMPRLDARQTVLAITLGVAAGGTALLIIYLRHLPIPALLDSVLFLMLMTYITWICVGLPEGIPLMRRAAGLAIAALVIDAPWAVLAGAIGSVAGILLYLPFCKMRERNQQKPAQSFAKAQWVTAATSAALAGTSLVFPNIVPTSHMLLSTLVQYGSVAVFGIVYFALLLVLLAGWLAYRKINALAFFRNSWAGLAINGPGAGLLIPLVALAYYTWPGLRVLVIASYIVTDLIGNWFNRAYTSLTGRIGDLRAISRIGQAISAQLDLEALFETIYHEIGQLLDTSGFYLALVDEETETITFPTMFVDGVLREARSRKMGNGVTEYVIRTCQPLMLLENALTQSHAMGLAPGGPGSRSYLGVPLISGEKVIGVMAVRDFNMDYAYGPADVQLMETIAAQVATAITNAQLYQQRQRQTLELSALHRISVQASSSLELDPMLTTILQEAVQVLPFQKAAIFLVDEDGKSMTVVNSTGLSPEYQQKARRLDIASNARTEAIRRGETLIVPDMAADPYFRKLLAIGEAEGFRAFAEQPLFNGDRLIGSFTAYYEEPHRFTFDELKLMQTLCGQIAIAIEQARLFEATRRRSHELETLYDASTAINASLSLGNILRALTISAIEALHTRSCLTLVMMEDQQTLRTNLRMMAEEDGIVDHALEDIRVLLDDLPVIRESLNPPAPVIVRRSDHRLGEGERLLLKHLDAASAIAVPVVARKNLVGLLVTGSQDGESEFLPEQKRLAEALANQAAVAIENAILFERTDEALARRLDEISSLELISQRMTRRLNIEAVMEQVTLAAAGATGAEICEVAIYDEPAELLRIVARRSNPSEVAADNEWSAQRGLTGHALQTGKTILVDAVNSDPDYYCARESVQSELVVPILLESRRLGVINLESTHLSAFHEDHARFITSLAEHAAIAIQNARLFEAVEKRAEEFNTLRSIALDLLSSTDVRDTLRVIARGALERTQASSIHIYLYDQGTDRLTFGTSLWADGTMDHEFAPPRPNGLTATVARSGERTVITHVRESALFAKPEEQPGWDREEIDRLQAIIGIPLKYGSEAVGVINIAFHDRSLVAEDMLRYLDFLAAQAAVAIAKAQLQEETRTGRDLLKAILDSSYDGILMFNSEGGLVIANSRAEWLMGAPFQEALGKSFSQVLRHIIRTIEPAQTLIDNGAHQLARQIKENPDAVTRRRFVVEGTTRHAIDEVTIPVIGHSGENLGRMFILRDMTHELELEAFRQEMSHMLVHDLRSPLGGVISGIHSALEEFTPEKDNVDFDIATQLLNISLTSANSLLNLVESILDVNRLEMGELPLALDEFDLRQIAQSAIQTLAETAKAAEIDVTLDAPSDLPLLMADQEKIERVLINLIDNALRYTPQGGTIRLFLTPKPYIIQVTVADNGPGIPLDQRERIFERFVQVNTSRRKRGSKGSGMGLTFCKLAVEAHGGQIWVEDAPEGGCAFHFTLPTEMKPAPASA